LVTILKVENCQKCDVVLAYDGSVFEPKDTPTSVAFGPGSHRLEMVWKLVALTSAESTRVSVTATGDVGEQIIDLPVEVVA